MSSYEYSDGGDRGGGTRGAGAVFSSSGSEADDPLGPEAEEEEYVLDTFVDDDSSALAVDHMIGQYRSFVEDYNRSIVAVEEAIDESFSDLWDATHDPITLRVEPFEQATLLQLARSESLHFNKICAVLGYICEEIDHLVVEGHAVQFPRLALFGSFLTGDDAEDDGEIQKNMGRLIEPLQDTVVWTQRCYTVLYNAMHQLACLYSKRQALFDVRGVHLTAVFEKVGALLAALVTLQEIFWQNPVLGEAWQLYRRMIQNMRNAPALYETTLEGLRQVEGVLDEIEGALFTDRIYESAIDQPFDADLRNVTGNRWLKDEMMYALANMQAFLASRIGQASETDQRERFVDFCALYGLYFALYQDTSEKKFFRSVWDMYKLVPIVHLFGPVYWFPNYFLTRTLPAMRKFAKKGDVDGARAKFLARLDEQLPSIVQGFTLQVSAWMARMESNLSKAATTGQILNNRMALFTQGVVLAYNIGHMFKSAMGLHISLEVILTDHHIVPLCHLVELSKAIEATYHRRSVLVGENVAHMVQQISIGLQRSLLPIKTKIEGARNPDNKALDTLAGVDMAMELLYGPASKGRQRMLPLAMSVVYSLGLITPKNQGEFEAQVRRLHLVANIQEHIRTACNFNHLFWGRQMLGVYFKHVYRSSSAHDLAYLLAGFRDAYSMLKTVQHEDEVVQLHMALEAEVEDRLEDCVIAPLGHDVEKDLRKNIKVNDLQRKPNPFVEHIHDVAPFFAIAPLILFEKHVDIKARVEHFLDQRFYNLTSLHQNDWRVYEEMRNLARQKFGLSLIDVHLPGQTHQEDLDCLVIMRKIDYFVANYCYNLQSQFFIERATSSRTLNSISIEHIATSIRMHGTGVMNTAVNYVYGYLESRLASVSKFLFDDHIRSPLMADVRWYREHRLEVDNVYPFDRAERFNRDIRRLGVVDNLTALDRFRVLITEIGNALGFIRMIRSGGLHHCAEAIKFIPDITNIVSFKALAERDGLSAEVVASAENLDNHIASLSSSFAEGTEYFQLLVDVFKTTMRGTANAHMETFHAVIPALTINYIEYIIESKDTVLKRNKEGASFTDDGFMVGCAYVLKVLGQTKNFASLHWFDSVTRRYAEQQLKVKAEHDALSRRERKRQRETAKLTLNRLARFATEFETLYFSFDGALIFFRD